jgi:pimeloyl-ACP methyl ester carboxylesterase
VRIIIITTVLIFTISVLGLDKQSNELKIKATWPKPIYYKSIKVNEHKIFYRESGSPDKPTILFLHGYPSSSHMYRHLIPLLSGRYHVIAPDNLGSGYSDKIDPQKHKYTFDLLGNVMTGFVKAMKLKKYTIYMQDFGAPVGFRLMMNLPKRVDGLISQNGNAYLEGLTPARQKFFKMANKDKSLKMQQNIYNFTGTKGIKNKQYLRDVSDRENIMSPDSWTHDLHFLENKKQRMIQVQLLQDYYNNLLAYPKWQSYLRSNKPSTLLVWGKNDPAFIVAGAKAFLKDLPRANLHLIDAGHFAMEERPVEIAKLIIKFMNTKK